MKVLKINENYFDSPFLYYLPTKGNRPMVWNVKGLLHGISLDSNTSIIPGLAKKYKYTIETKSNNQIGEDSSIITLNPSGTRMFLDII